jgi:hypothetical protein
MSTYEDAVDELYLGRLEDQIGELVRRCNDAPPAAPVIFFFPGGFASQLVRAIAPAPQGPPFLPIWLNCSILFGIAREMRLQGDRDLDDVYILPDGPIDFVYSYDGFEQWCDDTGIPLFIFGWDWRRKSAHAADFFLTKLLPAIDAEVSAGGYGYNPLENFWLVSHSFGGAVIKNILNQSGNPYVQKMRGAIAVANPFYGSGGQVHRFFVGESDLNATLHPDGAATCTSIVSTLPANYEILFLDHDTFIANKDDFLKDPCGYDLKQYPSLDAADNTTPADPYFPIPGPPPPNPEMVRYIQNYNFSWELLSDGLKASRLTSQRLDPAIAAKFWNVRCVQTDASGADLDETCVAQTWALVSNDVFDPDVGPDPITDTFGPGDGVVPAWSARLIGLDDSHVVTLKAPCLEHQNLMNEGIVQVQLSGLLNLPAQLRRLAQTHAATRPVKVATRQELNDVTRMLREATSIPILSDLAREAAALAILVEYSPDQRKALLTRAYFDAHKTPKQHSGAFDGSETKPYSPAGPSEHE